MRQSPCSLFVRQEQGVLCQTGQGTRQHKRRTGKGGNLQVPQGFDKQGDRGLGRLLAKEGNDDFLINTDRRQGDRACGVQDTGENVGEPFLSHKGGQHTESLPSPVKSVSVSVSLVLYMCVCFEDL